MAKRCSRVFLADEVVTHEVLGGEYRVIDSRSYYTQVVTHDTEEIDISFPTEDLRTV